MSAPTRRVPDDGMPWWGEPDPQRDAEGDLDPRLPLVVLEETTGWAHVRCENDFECWVDAALLVELRATDVVVENAPPEAVPEPTEPVEAPLETELVAAPAASRMGKDARVSIALSIAGAALAIVGGFLPWYSAGGADATAWDIRVVALFTKEPTDVSLQVGPILLLAALSLLALALRRPLPAWAALAVAGVPLVLGLAGLAFYSDLPGSSTSLGIGVIATLAGSLVMLAGLALSPRMVPRPLIRIA